MLRFLTLIGLITSSALAQSGTGTGLVGQYYDTAAFGTLKTTRTDAAVSFNWSTAIPTGTAITNADTFSVAWSGQIEPEFSGLHTFHVTADDGARLWVNDQMIACRTYAAAGPEMRGQVNLTEGKRVNIRLEYIEQTGSASVKLEWSCAERARETIPTARLYPVRVDKVGGSLLKEHWTGITGGEVSSLTSNANYPDKPDGREFVTNFECLAQDWADSYGTRVTGFIVPPVTGSYTFAVSGDEVVELYLSTDSTSANKSLVASCSSATAFRAWGTPSTTRTLTQGVRYFVELLHKENTGADHWSVGWKKPGDPVFSVIPGSALARPGTTTAQPAEANLLNTMAREHPRLFSTAERFARLKAAWSSPTPSQPKTWAASAVSAANTILTQPPVIYAPDVRGTILNESRTAKDRIYKLGVAWWLTNDPQYAERAWTELNAVADNTLFPNWNPSHFLDTAEMTHACAIGYDWFYHYWTQPRRDTIRTAIINKGLNAGLSQYTSNASWSRSTGNNWNQVCNGGLTIGALAVGTESEALTENILNRAINSTRPCWKHFTTDNGAWYEGPGYWGYTTEYGIRMLAALEWVLGSDFGIGATANVSEAGFAPINSLGTANIIFNFADAGAGGAPRGPQFQWMAGRYGIPLYDAWENAGSGSALSALWWNDHTGVTVAGSGAAPDMVFHGEATTSFQPQEMVTLRGRWNDSRATFVGVKAGEMGAAHGNLDAGTFVLDALGKRWFHDLGGDNYALPNYFSDTPNASGTDRWDYYRMRPEGQNVLAINPDGTAGMTLDAVAPLVAYQSEPGGTGSFAIHDLTPVYSGMTRVWRGTRMMGARNQVLVQDEIQSGSGKTVWWFAHYTHPSTSVVIAPDGASAMLTQGAERLWCRIVSGGGTFQIMDAVPLPTSPNPVTSPSQNANTGYRKLAINLTNVTNTTLAVWFVPLQTGDPVPTTLPAVSALNSWNIANSNDPPVAVNGAATSDGENPVDIDLRNYVTDDATPGAQMRFTVGNPVEGTVTLLDDGFTARFTPDPGYTGVPNFTFTATDVAENADTILAYDFDAPDATSANITPDVSGNGRDGTIDFAAAGTYSLVTDKPASLAPQGARSIDLVENGTTATRVQRVFAATELNWNTDNWTVAGWFKRRDTTNDDIVWHISDGDGFGSNNELYLNCPSGQTTVRLQHFDAAGAVFDVDIVKTGITAGTWYHFTVVRDGTSLSLYIDGTLVGADTAFALALKQTNPLVFGGHANPAFQPARWFDGGLDDLLVSKAVLDGPEIASLANGLTARHFGGLSSTATISLSAAAVNCIWTSPTSGDWSTGANWQGGAPPTGTRGTSVQFFTGQTLAGGSIASSNDIAGTFQMNNLTLAGTSSAATTTTISGGALQLLNNGVRLPTVNLTGTSGTSPNILSYHINTPVVLAADTTFNATHSGTFIFNGAISGAGGVIRNSTSSKLILAGTNSYTGGTTINAGTLQIGNDNATGTLGTGDVINHGQLRFDRTGTLVVPNSIGGTGSLYIDCPIHAGTVTLGGANTFDGNVTVNSGSLRITNSTALGDGAKTVTLSNGTAGAPRLLLDGGSDPIELLPTINYLTSSNTGAIVNESGDNTVSGAITLTAGGGDTKVLVNAGTLTLAGNLSPNTTNRTLDLAGAGAGLVTGSIANGSAVNTLALAKNDSGTWTLSGPVAITGPASVNNGLLAVNGSFATGAVTVGSSGRLGGSGTVAGNTTVNGTLQPGSGPGAIAFGGTLTFGAASKYSWELASNNTTEGFDSASVAGALTVTAGAALDLVLNNPGSATDFADAFWQSPRSWPVLTGASRSGSFNLGAISADSTGKAAAAYGAFSLAHTATGVNLLWTPALPVIAINATTPTANEAGTLPGVITFSRTNGSTAAATVNLTVSGTATSGSDYDALPDRILLPAGQGSVTLTVTPVDDSAAEDDETVIVTLAAGAGYTVDAPASATVTIASDETIYLWNRAASGSFNWSDAANWSGAAVPISGPSSSLDFLTGTTLAAVTVTPVNDLANPFTANTLTLGGTGPGSGLATVALSGNAIGLMANPSLDPVVNLAATGTTLAYAVANPVTLDSNTTFQGNGNATFTLGGIVSGPGSLTKTGSSKLILNGDNTYAGGTLISDGTLQLGTDSAAGSAGAGPITNNATLRIERSGTFNLDNAISGTGSLNVDSPKNISTLVLSGTNSFTGGVTVNSGAVRVTNSSALGSGAKTVTLNNGTNGAPQLLLDGGGSPIELPASIGYLTSNDSSGAIVNEAGVNNLAGPVTLTGGGGSTRIYSNAGTLTLSGPITASTTGRTLKLMGAGNGAITGTISDGNTVNVLSLSKEEAGTWTLAGNNSYTGSTTIKGGRLILTGSLAGSLSTNNGFTFAPQGLPSVAGAFTQSSSSILQVRMNGSTAGADYDQLHAGGNVTLGGTLDLVCGPHLAPGSTFTILTKTSPGAISGTFADLPDNSTFTAGGYTFAITYTGGTGNDLVLTLITTPIEQWRFIRFGSIFNTGPGLDTADPDGDGIVNLMEYATNLNPAANDVVPQSLTKTGSVLDFVHTINKSATDVTCIVEWSDTLGNDWSTSGVMLSPVPGSDDGVTRRIKATLPTGTSQRRFVRLRVTRP